MCVDRDLKNTAAGPGQKHTPAKRPGEVGKCGDLVFVQIKFARRSEGGASH